MPSQVRWLLRELLSDKAPVVPDDPFVVVEGRKGFLLRLPAGITLLIERSCITALLVSVALYTVAAFLANEWLYLLAASLLLSAILGMLIPTLVVCLLRVEAWLPEYGVNAECAEVGLRLSQYKLLWPLNQLLPLSSLRVRLVLARRTADDWLVDESCVQKPLHFAAAGYEISATVRLPVVPRGVYKLSHVEIGSCMPFGLAWAIKSHPLSDRRSQLNTMVVLPRVCEIWGNFLQSLTGIQSSVGLSFASVRAFSQSTSVRGIREFRVGDTIRHIHWPSSARLSKLLVREFESEVLPIFDVYLDLTAGWQNRQQFELAVFMAHSLIQFGHDRDMLPELFVHPPLDAGDMHHTMHDLPQFKTPLEMLSEILARVEPLPQRSNPQTADDVGSRYQLLVIRPAREAVVHGEQSALFPVDLVAISGGDPVRGGRTDTVLATIYGEKDLHAL